MEEGVFVIDEGQELRNYFLAIKDAEVVSVW
jgi:hypothetical protein